jgi:PBP1b-binding outer membrane lipoprotein LpoB
MNINKIFFAFCILASIVIFAGCSAFSNTETHEYEYIPPYNVTVLAKFDNSLTEPAVFQEKFTAEINKIINTSPADNITVANCTVDISSITVDEAGNFVNISLVLNKVPPQKAVIETTFFHKTRTIKMFNPISVLPKIDGVTYYFRLELKYRSTKTNASVLSRKGINYEYFWDTGDDIIIIDTFANAPIYYVIAVAAAGIVFLIVYFTCKKNIIKI